MVKWVILGVFFFGVGQVMTACVFPLSFSRWLIAEACPRLTRWALFVFQIEVPVAGQTGCGWIRSACSLFVCVREGG